MKHYLLTGEKWIPVLRRGGSAADVSLLELFEHGEDICDLSVPPATRVALMRLLLCIVMRSLPLPSDRSEWEAAKSSIAPQAVAYLKHWETAFDLYGDRPFLQVNGLEISGDSTLDKLDFTLASGNNHTLFDHLAGGQRRPQSPAWQARMLLVTQNFAASGLYGPNRWHGQATNALTGNPASPALDGSPLHTFLIGDNIIDTLHLNLITADELRDLNLTVGVPVWEQPPDSPGEAQRFRTTLLGRLAPLSRAIKLPEEGCRIQMAIACNYARLPEFSDPFLANRTTRKSNSVCYLSVQADRHPWRELTSLLMLNSTSDKVTAPHHINKVIRGWTSADKVMRLWCGGVAVDKAKYIFSGEWLFSFTPNELFIEETIREISHFATKAESIENLIKKSVALFWKNLSEIKLKGKSLKIVGGKEKAINQALSGYWQRVDTLAEETLISAATDGFIRANQQLKEISEYFFTIVLPLESSHGLMALGKTLPYFHKGLHNILNGEPKGEAENGR